MILNGCGKSTVTHSVGVVEEDTVSVAVALEALIERVHTVQVVKLKQRKVINIPFTEIAALTTIATSDHNVRTL